MQASNIVAKKIPFPYFSFMIGCGFGFRLINFFSAGRDANNSTDFFERFCSLMWGPWTPVDEEFMQLMRFLQITFTLPMSNVYSWSKGFIFFRELFQMMEWWDRYFNWVCNRSFRWVKFRICPFTLITSIDVLLVFVNKTEISLYSGSDVLSKEYQISDIFSYYLVTAEGIQHKFYRQCVEPISYLGLLVLFWNS